MIGKTDREKEVEMSNPVDLLVASPLAWNYVPPMHDVLVQNTDQPHQFSLQAVIL